jgi:hypothetical protein
MNEKRRRSVFGAPSQTEVEAVGVRSTPLLNERTIEASAPLSVVEQLKFAETRKASTSPRRRPGQVSYRGFPNGLMEKIRAAANELQVTVDEVIRATLEYALGTYWSGRLALDPSPAKIKMTLYPKDSKTRVTTSQRKGPKRKKTETPRWTTVVTFRGIPQPVQGAVRQVADEHDIPVGEVAAYLIEYGINAFRSGELVLRPVPRPGSNTLFED